MAASLMVNLAGF